MNIQETMTNMMKYSDASSCKVKFSRLNKMIKVTIEDNGVGCRNIKKGMGLSGIEERMTQLGGKLIVDGSSGFSLTMLLDVGGKV